MNFIVNYPMWTLDEARSEIVRVQLPSRAYGYHVALGGGVLNNGKSFKDLDVYFLPLDDTTNTPNPMSLQIFLKSVWGQSTPISDDSYGPSKYYALKLKFSVNHKRIDVFVPDPALRMQVDKEK